MEHLPDYGIKRFSIRQYIRIKQNFPETFVSGKFFIG